MIQIRGIALLAACYLVGQTIGVLLGRWLDINANVGGVGFAMLLLILVHERMDKYKLTSTEINKGILFWSDLYIPVIVAMSAIQNVKATTLVGIISLLGGVVPVSLSIMMLPRIMRLGSKQEEGSSYGR